MNQGIRNLKLTMAVGGGLMCVGLVLGVYFMVYAPLNAEAADLRAKRDEFRNMRDSRHVVHAANERKRKHLLVLQGELKSLEQRIPPDARVEQLLRNVSGLANESGVKLLDFQPGGGGEWGQLRSAIVRVQLRGGYTGFCRFLRGLNTINRVTRTTKIHVRMAERKTGTLEVSLELHGLHRTEKLGRPQVARRTL